MGEAELPPVQRRRFASERREWKKMVEIQQHLLLTSSRSSKHISSSSGSEKAPQTAQKHPMGPKPKPPVVPVTKPPPPEDQVCSSAPALLGEQRILLHTAEVMETLSILLQSDSSVCSSSSGTDAHQESCSAREKDRVRDLHDQMRLFMKERCLLVIKKECSHQVALVRKLRDRIKNLALAEDTLIGQLLSTGHPILPKDVLHLSFLRKSVFLENLQAAVYSWPCLLKFLGHTFNSFDAQWHSSLDVVLRWTQVRLDSLAEQSLRWAWLSLRNDILLLCQMDAGDLHADWIGGVFSSCHFFNQLLVGAHDSSASVTPLPVSAVLSTLAARQAEVSAARLGAFVNLEVRKAPEEATRVHPWTDVGTVEFWSAAATREAPGTAALLTALIQSGQSLLLKYLYAATCIDHSAPPQATKQKQGRALWQKQPPRATRPSCFELEKLYWDHYWDCFSSQLAARLATLHPVPQLLGSTPALSDVSLLRMLACQNHALSAALAESYHGTPRQATRNLLLQAVQPLSAYLATTPEGDCTDSCLAQLHLALTLWHTLHWAERGLRSSLRLWAPSLLPQLVQCDLQAIISSARRGQASWDSPGESAQLVSHASSLCASALDALQGLQASVPTRYQDNCYRACLQRLQSAAVPSTRHFKRQGLECPSRAATMCCPPTQRQNSARSASRRLFTPNRVSPFIRDSGGAMCPGISEERGGKNGFHRRERSNASTG
ncbi:hypothetical protein HPB48_014229 [Haemaphysalis longicornis]|uniref:Coiled-coil domain-containing protein 142 n=1 Tax=Haemaphysalis longicornis TaxID=44386 RepID=A0A9J6FIZ6_HAELO|nr:hypothetical protein HPB48_014229 [Haemaphysalis longicornis]